LENSTTLEESVEKILKLLGVSNHCHGFEFESGVSQAYFFKTAEWKRSFHIRKILDLNLPMHLIQNYQLIPNTKQDSVESRRSFDCRDNGQRGE
jgi:hypothetical protein